MTHAEVQGELFSMGVPIGTAYAVIWISRLKKKFTRVVGYLRSKITIKHSSDKE